MLLFSAPRIFGSLFLALLVLVSGSVLSPSRPPPYYDAPDAKKPRLQAPSLQYGVVSTTVSFRGSRDLLEAPAIACKCRGNSGIQTHDATTLPFPKAVAYLCTQPATRWGDEATEENNFLRQNRALRASFLVSALRKQAAEAGETLPFFVERRKVLPLADREMLRGVLVGDEYEELVNLPPHGLDSGEFRDLAGDTGISVWARSLPPVVSGVGFADVPVGARVVLKTRFDPPEELLTDQSFPLFRFKVVATESIKGETSVGAPLLGAPAPVKVFDLLVSKDTPISALELKKTVVLNWIVPATDCPRFLLTRGDMLLHAQTHHAFALSVFGYETGNVFMEWAEDRARDPYAKWGSYGPAAPVLGAGELTLTQVVLLVGNKVDDKDMINHVWVNAATGAPLEGPKPKAVVRVVMGSSSDSQQLSSYFVITKISNSSGHYLPKGGELFDVLVPQLLGQFGEDADLLFGSAWISARGAVLGDKLSTGMWSGLKNDSGSVACLWDVAKEVTHDMEGFQTVLRARGEMDFRKRNDQSAAATKCERSFEGAKVEAPMRISSGVQVSPAQKAYHDKEQLGQSIRNLATATRFSLNRASAGASAPVFSQSFPVASSPHAASPTTVSSPHRPLGRRFPLNSKRLDDGSILHGGLARLFLTDSDFVVYSHADRTRRFYAAAAEELRELTKQAGEAAAVLRKDPAALEVLRRLRLVAGGKRARAAERGRRGVTTSTSQEQPGDDGVTRAAKRTAFMASLLLGEDSESDDSSSDGEGGGGVPGESSHAGGGGTVMWE